MAKKLTDKDLTTLGLLEWPVGDYPVEDVERAMETIADDLKKLQADQAAFLEGRLNENLHFIQKAMGCTETSELLGLQSEWLEKMRTDYASRCERFFESFMQTAMHSMAPMLKAGVAVAEAPLKAEPAPKASAEPAAAPEAPAAKATPAPAPTGEHNTEGQQHAA